MPTQFTYWSLDFPRRWEERRSSKGEFFRVSTAYGMPRIHEKLLSSAFYLFRDVDSANANRNIGGTGFFVGMDSVEVKGLHTFYAVSNTHVVHSIGASIIRINTPSATHLIELGPEDWEAHPGGDDIAIAEIELPQLQADVAFFHQSAFIHKQEVGGAFPNWGVGDDVFMIGLFTGYSGELKNEPSARSGTISIVPKGKIHQPDRNFDQESICLDMRSLSGYSGSPVIAYRQPPFGTIGPHKPDMDAPSFGLLGIHWGSIKDISDVEFVGKGKKRKAKLKAHAGITCIAPAWKIWEFLMGKKFTESRIKGEKEWQKNNPPKSQVDLEG